MEIVSPQMAERLLNMLETGASNINTEFTAILNQLVNYVIFLETINLLRWALLFLGAVIVARAFRFWILSAETENKKNEIRGWRNFIVGGMTIAAIWFSFSSVTGLGKILLAPKIYMIEMAIDKVKAIKVGKEK